MKEQLSKYLEAVKAGEEVIITERGRPIARLGPMEAREREEAGMLRLVRAGLVRPPLEKLPKSFWDIPRPADPEGRTLAALIEDRETGR